jgi:hypothetical protein
VFISAVFGLAGMRGLAVDGGVALIGNFAEYALDGRDAVA